MIIPPKKDIILNIDNLYRREKSFKLRFPEFYKYLIEKYQHICWKKFTELLYLYINDLDNPPTCAICGNPVNFQSFNKGYKHYCSNKCAQNSQEIKEKIKQGNLKKYGVEYSLQSEKVKEKSKQTCIEKYGVKNISQSQEIKEKIKQGNLKKYGVEYPLSLKEVQEKRKSTNIKKYGVENVFESENIKGKIKQTNLAKYGVENPSQYKPIKEKSKQTCIEKYGVEYYFKTPELKQILSDKHEIILKKSYNTKKKNHSFNTSKIEQDFTRWLDDKNINFIRQYHNNLYPFDCDFYFPDKDLYLEIQGTWTHGGHPYNPDNKEDQDKLQFMKSKNNDFYNSAIETWTVRDPLKRKIAKENNLNWIEVFTNDNNTLIEKIKDFVI